MSTDIMTNQTVKDVLTSVAASSPKVNQAGNRQNVAAQVAVQGGKALPPEPKPAEVTSENLQKVVEKLNEHVQKIQRDLQFSVDDASGRTIVRVINSETEEVVRQIPSEEVLRISRNIEEQLADVTGLLFETSA